jgi:hypothetical protein
MGALTSIIEQEHHVVGSRPSLLDHALNQAFDFIGRLRNRAVTRSAQRATVTTTSPMVAPIMTAVDLRSHELDSAFACAFGEALFLAEQDEIEAPEDRCWIFAHEVLNKIFCDPKFAKLDLPLILPLDLGGLSIEWHDHDLNIEIRFRKSQPIYVVLEDALGQISEYRGRDSSLSRSFEAITALSHRSI